MICRRFERQPRPVDWPHDLDDYEYQQVTAERGSRKNG